MNHLPHCTVAALLLLSSSALAADPPAPEPAAAPKAPPPPAAAPAAPGAGYKDGFFLQSEDGAFKLKVRGLVQVRATGNFPLEASDESSATLAIQRAQLDLGGNVFTKQLTFQLKTEFGQGFTFARDAWANWAFAPGALELRVGLAKRPFSRQELTGDTRQEFVERGLVNGAFKTGRDLGVTLHNDIDKSPALEWSVGAYAGTQDKPSFTGKALPGDDGVLALDSVKLSNVPATVTPTFAGRFGINFNEVKGYSEIDAEGGAPRGGVAVSLLEAVELGDAQGGLSQVEVDAILKLYGFDVSAAIFLGAAQTGVGTFEQEAALLGLHAQAGWLYAEHWHPALRYQLVHHLDGSGEAHEIAAGLSVLFFGQSVQWQNDVAAMVERASAGLTTDARLRSQLVLAF